jgi:hypothetical protein
MRRIPCFIAAVFVTLATQAIPAQAQFYGGYEPFGWWGWYGGAGSTVQGDIARGRGQFAVGAGIYNELTAQADAINADTLWRWNQYLYLSQQEANRAH